MLVTSAIRVIVAPEHNRANNKPSQWENTKQPSKTFVQSDHHCRRITILKDRDDQDYRQHQVGNFRIRIYQQPCLERKTNPLDILCQTFRWVLVRKHQITDNKRQQKYQQNTYATVHCHIIVLAITSHHCHKWVFYNVSEKINFKTKNHIYRECKLEHLLQK